MVSFGVLARKIFGSSNDRRIKAMRPRVEAINALEAELEQLSDEALKARTAEFRKQLAEGKTLDEYLAQLDDEREERKLEGDAGAGTHGIAEH